MKRYIGSIILVVIALLLALIIFSSGVREQIKTILGLDLNFDGDESFPTGSTPTEEYTKGINDNEQIQRTPVAIAC